MSYITHTLGTCPLTLTSARRPPTPLTHIPACLWLNCSALSSSWCAHVPLLVCRSISMKVAKSSLLLLRRSWMSLSIRSMLVRSCRTHSASCLSMNPPAAFSSLSPSPVSISTCSLRSARRETSAWWFHELMGWTAKRARTHHKTRSITSHWPQHNMCNYTYANGINTTCAPTSIYMDEACESARIRRAKGSEEAVQEVIYWKLDSVKTYEDETTIKSIVPYGANTLYSVIIVNYMNTMCTWNYEFIYSHTHHHMHTPTPLALTCRTTWWRWTQCTRRWWCGLWGKAANMQATDIGSTSVK